MCCCSAYAGFFSEVLFVVLHVRKANTKNAYLRSGFASRLILFGNSSVSRKAVFAFDLLGAPKSMETGERVTAQLRSLSQMRVPLISTLRGR